jgi:hypothetical protein
MDTDAADPSTRIDEQRMRGIVPWLASVVVANAVGLALVGLVYAEPLDCSNPGLHESPNTLFGWCVALAASLVPVVVSIVVTRRRRRPLDIAVGVVAALCLLVWAWLLTPTC